MLLGPNVTGWHGAEAARRLRPLFPKDSAGTSFAESKDEEPLQEQEEHVLFSLVSGLVGFEVFGLLKNHKLQLGVQM